MLDLTIRDAILVLGDPPGVLLTILSVKECMKRKVKNMLLDIDPNKHVSATVFLLVVQSQ